MADFHVLEVSPAGDAARVVFHLATPVGLNTASVQYAAALKQYLESLSEAGTIPSAVPGLETDDPTEHAAIQAGQIFEYLEQVRYSAKASNAEKLAVIVARQEALAGTIPGQIAARLQFWGYQGGVS